jgi:glycosyltransferase involved in cell wall biosynthesis
VIAAASGSDSAKLPLSVCIIACNEEHNLRRCLGSVCFADEVVVVVDTRSRDGTEAIAREMGARTIVHAYEGNVEQKAFALAEAKRDWILSIDADEAIDPVLAGAIQAVVSADGPEDGFEMNRLTWHLGRWIRHGEFYPDWQLRLFRRSRGRFVGVNPHGHVEVDGATRRLEGDLQHFSYRDLSDQVARIQDFSRVQALTMWNAGRRVHVLDLLVRPPFRFLRAYLFKQGFRDGMAGFMIAAATAFHVFLKYAKLWELGRDPGARREAPSGKAGAHPGTPRPGA